MAHGLGRPGSVPGFGAGLPSGFDDRQHGRPRYEGRRHEQRIRPIPAPADPARDRAFLGVERSLTGRRWVERLDGAGAWPRSPSRSGTTFPTSSRACSPGAASRVDDAPDFLDPTLKVLMPDPSRPDRHGQGRRAHRRRGRRRRDDRDLRRLRRRRRDLGGAARALPAPSGPRPAIYIPDRHLRGLRAERRGDAQARRGRGAGSSSPSIAARPASRRSPTARELGLDVVVLDHHQLGAELPPAVALVNPNRQDDLSGLGHLAAVGVTFLAVVAVNRAARAGAAGTASRPEPDLLALARPGRARHGLRRGAAHRAQPRLRRQGPARHGPPRQPRPRRARRRRPARRRRRRPIISASCSGRASMPAGGSATPRSARGCSPATIRPSASGSPPSSTG